ncbi:MAG TPA: DRTGG domain-containing protein [Dehalococcoidia bacterium]|nr:DRTGG domain-containing protein [Dehalococcoidia bacterium]
MPTLLVAAAESLSGKTTVAVALSRNLSSSGSSPSLTRTGDDANAEADRRTLSAISGTGETTIVELPAGAWSDESYSGAKVIIVATPGTAAAAAKMATEAADSLAGIILNRVPTKGETGAYEGIAPVAVLPEDRVLGAPDLASVASALTAETENMDGHEHMVMDALVIASIAADPGQSYFDRTRASSVIVRNDKPDLQLAALNSGAECFIITGGRGLLSYVRDRIAEDEIPVLSTALDTKDTVTAIEKLYGNTPFVASGAKLRRLDELLGTISAAQLLS